jgi:surface antigen
VPLPISPHRSQPKPPKEESAMPPRFTFVLLACGALIAASAQAYDLQFLTKTPYANFSKEDKKLLMQNIDKALDEGKEGDTVAWNNDSTGAAGTITPEKSFERDGRKCRAVRIHNTFKTLKGEGSYNFCQDKNGKWQLAQ